MIHDRDKTSNTITRMIRLKSQNDHLFSMKYGRRNFAEHFRLRSQDFFLFFILWIFDQNFRDRNNYISKLN